MSTREADARTEVDQFKEDSSVQIYRDVNSGEILDPGDIVQIKDTSTGRLSSFGKFKAPKLTPEEQANAAEALKGALEAGQVQYPRLARTLLNQPEKLWLLGEIQLMLSPEANVVANQMSADLANGLITTDGQRDEYNYRTAHEKTQQLFWNEIGSKYEEDTRLFLMDSLARLSPEGANQVGAMSLAWIDSHGFEGNEEQLLENMAAWTYQESQSELGNEGFFGLIDSLQEQVEDNFLSPLLNAGVSLVSGAEEAARRKDLSIGRQFAYQVGLKPPEEAGSFGWWQFVSGGADALVEVGGDPLAWLAGVGAGAKAAKVIPLAADATRTGRVVAAARALLPKPFAGISKVTHGGRFARVTYALSSKTVDDLLEQTLKNGVAQDAFNLIKSGNMGKFQRVYPAWRGLNDETIRIIQEAVESPEEMLQVMRSGALDQLRNSGKNLDELTANARRSEDAMRSHVGEATNPLSVAEDQAARKFRNGIARTNDQSGATKEQVAKFLDDPDSLDPKVREKVEAGLKWWDEAAEPTNDLVRSANKAESEVLETLEQGDAFDIPFASTEPRGAGFADQATGKDNWTIEFGPGTRGAENDLNQIAMGSGKAEHEVFVSGKFTVESIDKESKVVHLIEETSGSKQSKSAFDKLLTNQDIPRELRLQAAKDRLALDSWNMKTSNVMILSEVPQRSKRLFSWQKVLDIKGTGRLATGVRRTAGRITPGRIPNQINLFRARQGADDLRRIGEHFGLEQNVLDELVTEFMGLERGARQEWVWDTFLRRIGRETGVPAFEHELIQFYSGAGIRNFSSSGVDLITDGKRIPMLPSQYVNEMPVPVEEMTQVFARARSIGTRSKLARAMGFNGRGLGKTAARRSQLVKRLRNDLGEKIADLSDEQVYDMAYSMVSPNAGMDARGIMMGRLMPKVGSWGNNLHNWFTKSMLVFRPVQWMWRVALLEEPIRAHIFNMPSLYSNPLQYMKTARESHYIWNMNKWAQANMSFGQDILRTVNKGGKKDILRRLDDLGIKSDVFDGDIPKTASGVRRAVSKFVDDALYGRTRPNRLDPIKRVPWAVKSRASNIAKAENALKKLDLPIDFNFADEAQEIAGRLVSGYLGEAVGASDRKLYQWAVGISNDEAFTHGRVWGGNLINFAEDEFGRRALHRRASILRGDVPDVTGQDLVNSSQWEKIAPDLRLKYGDNGDDVALAERYMDDMLGQEIDNLFRPFADEYSADDLADILDEFADHRRIEGRLGGVEVDWDLRSANHGGGVRQVGDFTASVRQNPALNIPSDLPAQSFDPRFLAEDDPGFPARISNWVLKTFGEDATQTLSRRPAWIQQYDRWYKNYTQLGVPEDIARSMATDNANKMVNYVFFNMDEAPYYVARLNRMLPFFGATYEVVGTWSYKMPVAVGGSWPTGAGEFARKFDRLIDAFVNTGILTREEQDDGSTSLTLNLVPAESDARAANDVGGFFQGAGYAAVNTLDQTISTLLGLEEGLGLRSQGYRLAAGHPLNPSDYGILSFAQADIGLNPATNLVVTGLASVIPGATGPRQEAAQEGESVAEIAERLNVDVEELVRYNREFFIDTEDFGSTNLYNGLLKGTVDASQIVIPANSAFNLPGSSLWDAISDTLMPFGELNSGHEFAANFIPSAFRWVAAGLALQNQPTDEFWKDSDLDGVFGGVLPKMNAAQAASQLNEAFMYLQAHDLVNGKGPLDRILEKEAKLEKGIQGDAAAIAQVRVDLGSDDQDLSGTEILNVYRAEINGDTEQFLNRAQKVAAESLILRGLTGQMLPTTPGHVRLEEQKIRDFWDTREYADNLKIGKGPARIKNFKSIEDIEEHKELLAAWLSDPTGDRARATFYKNNPQLMAYLTPKTFYKGTAPDIQSYEEYQRQIESGEREPAPLHVTMWRARSAAIQADHYNKYIAAFGNDPHEAAATALQNRNMYDTLKEEKDLEYQALEVWDEMHGSVYSNWRRDNFDTEETYVQDKINEQLNSVRDNLQLLLELEDYLDVELDLDGVASLNSGIRGAVAEISNAIRQFNELEEDNGRRNEYEAAINQYFQEVYVPYAERISELYDRLPEVADSERESLIYEQIKFERNSMAGTTVLLNGNTTVPFPNPLEYSWQGKDEEEREIKLQQWMTRPIQWMDLDQSLRAIERNPELDKYLPSTLADFKIYQEYTLLKIEIDEAFENQEITRSQRNKVIENLDENLRRNLVEQGRAGEVQIMDMTPYEKLELSELLPGPLGIYSENVRWYKQALEANEESPGSVQGRKFLKPLYDQVEADFYGDPIMNEAMRNLGINLQDETALDKLMPWLFFGYTGEN